ncbi:beta-N-acetylhexosaminidase [Blastococcus sp. DSM 46786]|uniref:glycoside hydrolase family 3 protein n=1 Tax=Blastococcus sp. DSM 46786 TaxID=1798227 RepID=UPI0008BF9768|nr:glycoside hydrolase family 3 N-terminal domain-containing protein [Blastococcus sp. DSM 46786]SEL00323.1 beta-N-acetylhexosaminidase [Blastococcus sp. DSM 46786]
MSELDRLVNGCLMPGFAGPAVPRWVVDALGEGLAGVCLYGQNLRADDPAEAAGRVASLSGAVHAARADALVAVDEEGGDVTRLEYGSGSSYPGNLALGVLDDEQVTAAVAAAIGADLRRAGVDVDLAPSVDVNSDSRNPVIGVRSFGADPGLVARHGAAWVRGLQSTGVAAAAKHFPGHGATTVDSHLDLPVVDVDEATFRRRELLPFVAAIEAGVRLVMTSHVVFPAFDEQPATLSRRLLVDLLRTELGFQGVLVTDALDMAGVRAAHGIPRAAALSLAAGSDLLLVGAEDGQEHCAAIRAAVAEHLRDGTLTEARLHEAAGRVARLRREPTATTTDEASGGVGLRAARSARRARDLSPLAAPAVVVELRAAANMAVGAARWSLADPLRELGRLDTLVTVADDDPTPDAVVADAAGRPLVVAARDAYRSPWQERWLRRLTELRPDAVTVALGMPDDLRLVPGPALAVHGASRACTRAAAEALAGR